MEKETKRQIFHLVLGLLIVLLIYVDLLTAKLIGIVILIGLILSFTTRRYKIPVIDWFLQTFEREKDIKHIPGKGVIFMFVGAFIMVFFFPKNVALASMMILALGDSLAPLVGRYGKIKHPFSNRRFLEGFIVGFIAGFLGAVIFVAAIPALIASLAAMIIEGVDLELKINPLDDNIMMPLVAGLVILLLRLV
jgi:dolichol kinase